MYTSYVSLPSPLLSSPFFHVTQTNGPEAYRTVKLYGYTGQADKVSRIIRKDKRWENDIQKAVARMMRVLLETKWKNAAKEELFLIDVGGNVGAHTMCASGLGYSTIVFEPLLANEIAIRSAVCENKLQNLVTLIPKGLGEAEQVRGKDESRRIDILGI